MEKYKAIVFDMDGTVLDTLDELTKSLNYVFARHGRMPSVPAWASATTASSTKPHRTRRNPCGGR